MALFRPQLSHVLAPFRKYCLLYLLEVSPPADDCTLLCSIHRRDSVLYIMLALHTQLPSMLQYIWVVISPYFFCILYHITLQLFHLQHILEFIFKIYTCTGCIKGPVTSRVLKSFNNRIYLYAYRCFYFPHWVELSDRTVKASKIHFECGSSPGTVFTVFAVVLIVLPCLPLFYK